ncbi:MAG TPA: ABC transporter substrate-binding protein, partial [Hyphomicrobiaceae bacterium]|nr:ABC transporter substrate-binding protein [Hyphomicrobiaceae bacterium]
MRTSSALLVAAIAAIFFTPAQGQTRGGTLRIYNTSQPPSASIHEESTIATNMPFMAIFNNLVLFDPAKSRNSFDTIVPELAESWAWDETGTKLTFKLRSGVAWHDGKPFTAKDVQCTWHRLNGKEPEYLKRNPRAIWYENLKEVTINGDYEA